jgi:hypothetical protein
MLTVTAALLAFNVAPSLRAVPAACRSSPCRLQEEAPTIEAPEGMVAVPEFWGPDREADMRIEGGSTLKTFQMPPWAERVQYILKSPSGRPVKAKVELWIGPIRCVHELIYDCMGSVSRESSFPVKATLQFKKLSPVLKISTDSTFEFPLECGVFIPKDDAEQKMWGKTTKDMFYGGSGGDKQVVQGGLDYVSKKSGGSIRSFDIPASWEKTQIMCWCVQSAAKQPRQAATHTALHPPLHSPSHHPPPPSTHSLTGRPMSARSRSSRTSRSSRGRIMPSST